MKGWLKICKVFTVRDSGFQELERFILFPTSKHVLKEHLKKHNNLLTVSAVNISHSPRTS